MSVAFSGCTKDNALDCFKSNGRETTVIRQPGAFNEIEINDKFITTVVQGPEPKVEVTAGANLLRNIRTYLVDSKLVIDNKNECNFVRGYKKQIRITITVPEVKRINNHGVGVVTIDENFVQDTMLVRATNSGDVNIRGRYKEIRTSSHGNGDINIIGECNTFYIYTNGTNFVDAEQLIVKEYAFVETMSIGDCTINATQLKKLEFNIWDSGNLYYIGEPGSITDFSNKKGSGRAIKK